MAAICNSPGIFALRCVVGLLSQSVTDQYIVRQAMWDNALHPCVGNSLPVGASVDDVGQGGPLWSPARSP